MDTIFEISESFCTGFIQTSRSLRFSLVYQQSIRVHTFGWCIMCLQVLVGFPVRCTQGLCHFIGTIVVKQIQTEDVKGNLGPVDWGLGGMGDASPADGFAGGGGGDTVHGTGPLVPSVE